MEPANRIHCAVRKFDSNRRPGLYISHYTKHEEIYKLSNGQQIVLASSELEGIGTIFYEEDGLFDFESGFAKLYDRLLLLLNSWKIPFDTREVIARNVAVFFYKQWLDNNKKLPCLCFLLGWYRYTYYSTEEALMTRVLRMSAEEFERINYGMVPANAQSLNLKCVEVETDGKEGKVGRSCTICLEELVGYAAEMPCKHMFHGECIVKWLQQSHYCPLCRFEMPIQKDN